MAVPTPPPPPPPTTVPTVDQESLRQRLKSVIERETALSVTTARHAEVEKRLLAEEERLVALAKGLEGQKETNEAESARLTDFASKLRTAHEGIKAREAAVAEVETALQPLIAHVEPLIGTLTHVRDKLRPAQAPPG